MIQLELYPGRFYGSSWKTIKADHALFAAWINPTPVSNTEYWRSLSLNLHFPFVRWVSAYVTDDEINNVVEVQA